MGYAGCLGIGGLRMVPVTSGMSRVWIMIRILARPCTSFLMSNRRGDPSMGIGGAMNATAFGTLIWNSEGDASIVLWDTLQ